MQQPSIRRVETRFRGVDGLSLQRRAWLPPETDRVLLVVHGLAEHSGRYDALGAWFAERGTAVHAYDQRGHGESAGRRGHLGRFDELLDDLALFLERVESEHPGVPHFLLGHSMGGLVVAAFARERHPDLIGIVTSGAALSPPKALPRFAVRGARLLRRIAPRLALGANLDLQGLSRDPAVLKQYLADPLVFSKITVSMAVELFAGMERSAEGGAAVDRPMLLLHGGEDPICPPVGSQRFREGLTRPGSELRIYPKLRHEIFNEPERFEIFEELLDWLVAREREVGSVAPP